MLKTDYKNIKKGDIVYIASDDKRDAGQEYEGKVVSVGTGRFTESGKNIPVAVNVNDKILFDKFAGDPIVIEDKEYLLLNENNVIGIIR